MASDVPLAPGRLWRGKDPRHGYLRLVTPGLVTIDGNAYAAWTAIVVDGPSDGSWQRRSDTVCIRIVDLDEYFDPHLLCDFCSRPGPVWHYPTRGVVLHAETIMEDLSTRSMQVNDAPGWGACERCAELIELGDAEALAQLTVASLANVSGDPDDDARIRDDVRALTIDYHRTAFFDERCGPRERME